MSTVFLDFFDILYFRASFFATFLQTAKEYALAHPEQPRLITINAWNEWVEGSYLLPDRKHGFGYLEAVRDVVTGKYDK